MSAFARLVSEAMKARGLGLRELCRNAEIDPSFLSKVLAGKRNPPSEEDVLRRLAQALELEPLTLIVSAGRIPSEWGDISSRPDLLRRLSDLVAASGRSPLSRVGTLLEASRRPESTSKPDKWRSRPSSTPLVRKPFSEELL